MKRIFKQSFAANFGGVDGLSSSIEQDRDTVNRAVNYEPSVSNSLRGRVGCQTSGAHGFFAIFPYRYTRTTDQYDLVYQTSAGAYPTQTVGIATTKTAADGASIEKLVALNRQAWVLDTMNVTITQTNAGAYTWYSYVSGSNINFKILKDGVSILDTSLGDGITSLVSIYSLLGTIDALADLAVSRTTRGTCFPLAIVNGNQTATFVAAHDFGNTYRITVNAGHTFKDGDIISFNNNPLAGYFVLTTTATTIDFVGDQTAVVSLLNNDVVGYMGQPASNFPISTISSESAGVMTIGFPYWRLILDGDGIQTGTVFRGAYTLWGSKTATSFYAPATSVNSGGNLYVAASSSIDQGVYSSTTGYGGTWANTLCKIDGQMPVRAGLPKRAITLTAPGAGALTGTYKYKMFHRRVDAQGNIIDGPVSDVSSITYAAQYGRVSCSTILTSDNTGFGTRSCIKRTTESPAAGQSFYVDNNAGAPSSGYIQPGDVVCLTDNTAQKVGLWNFVFGVDVVGTLHRTRCTAYTALTAVISPTSSSIKVEDSSSYQINDNTVITSGLTAVFLRTTAGGNQYYVLCEIPSSGIVGAAGLVFFDNVTDAVLTAGQIYTEVEIGKEHDAPPTCSLVCQHQGGLVVARGPLTPNTVAYSSTSEGGLEYFPTASNSLDVPSTQSGSITCIASDTDDRLAVFKDRAYYDIIGDLDGGTFSVNVRNEGDYGIASQASLVRANGALVGLSKNGFVIINDGRLEHLPFADVNAKIINQSYQFSWATAVNDYFNRCYICTIPQVSGEPVGFSLDYSKKEAKWFERSYATKIDQAGGGAMIGDTLYHLSQTSPYGVFRRLVRFSSNSPANGNGDSFIDNTGAITYILESNPINFGDPAQKKTVIRMRIWSVPNDYIVDGWVPFLATLETGASCLSQYVGSAYANGTSVTLSYAGITDVFKNIQLKNCQTFFYMYRLTTSTIRQAPFITGVEILGDANYEKEDYQP